MAWLGKRDVVAKSEATFAEQIMTSEPEVFRSLSFYVALITKVNDRQDSFCKAGLRFYSFTEQGTKLRPCLACLLYYIFEWAQLFFQPRLTSHMKPPVAFFTLVCTFWRELKNNNLFPLSLFTCLQTEPLSGSSFADIDTVLLRRTNSGTIWSHQFGMTKRDPYRTFRELLPFLSVLWPSVITCLNKGSSPWRCFDRLLEAFCTRTNLNSHRAVPQF